MFTQGIVIDLLRRRPEGEWEIALVDIEPEILAATERMVRRYLLAADTPVSVSATTDRRQALPGATVVTCTIGVGGRRAWELDVFIPRKHGIFQPVGDSVMPGGISRAMRMIPQMVEIARDVERLCPNAWFFNYGNPMTAILRALYKVTKTHPLGLCIGVDETLRYLASFAEIPYDQVTATWAGVNHLTWILDLRVGGEDAWPMMRRKAALQRQGKVDYNQLGRMFWEAGFKPPKVQSVADAPFSWDLLEEFGAFPAPLDRHVTEFFPERFPEGRYWGKTLGMDAYSFEACIAYGEKIYSETLELGKGEEPIGTEHLRSTTGEHMQLFEILDSIRYDRRRWYSVNVPNAGSIRDWPVDAVVELPATATAGGLVALPVGELPASIRAVILRRLAAVEATVEAALTGKPKLMTEAMILDGGVSSYGVATKLTDELLRAQAVHLPQFG